MKIKANFRNVGSYKKSWFCISAAGSDFVVFGDVIIKNSVGLR